MGEGAAAVACTAIVADQLPLARVLARDIGKIHPGWSLVVLALDGDLPGDEPFEVVRPADLTPDRPGLLELMTDSPVSLRAALRPALLTWSAERFDSPVVWLEPTVRVLGALDPLVAAARDGVAVVPLHSGRGRPAGLGVRGALESGALAVGDRQALRWWASATVDEACRPGARLDLAAERLLGALLGVAERSHVVRDPALCAGWWTFAAGRRLVGDPPEIDGLALRALNLAGFDPRRPHSMSSEDAAGAARVSDTLELATLLADHADRLLRAGWKPPRARPWPYGELAGGIPVGADLRELFALANREQVVFPSPFTETGCAALLDWIDGESSLGRGVGRYLERVYRRRVDLQVAFPDLAGADGPRLAAWMEEHGGPEEPVLAALLKRRAEVVGSGTDEERRPVAEPGQPSVRIVGYLRDGIGLGEAARSYAGALRAAGVDVETVSVPVPLYGRPGADRPPRRRGVAWETSSSQASDAPAVEIVCMNPPELARLTEAARPPDVRRIGVWAWELKEPPSGWSSAYSQVDELWVFSEYVAAAFRDAPVPVAVVPLAVDVDRLASVARRAHSGGPFTFLFAFDLFSTLERKNPLGSIAAFRAAFAPNEGPRLVIKTSNGDNRPEELEQLRIAALGRSDIEVVDAFLAPPERDALIAGCDCYVSLHRAEGFGLTLAEAMAAGRPTIATGFSGNLDFMTADTAYLIDSRPVRVETGSEIYPAGGFWREPDLHAAAAAMRRVYDDPEAARARGAKGREHVRRLLSPEVVGARARDRLQQVAPASGGWPLLGLRTALARRRVRA